MNDRWVVNGVTFHELLWDSEFFRVSCGKAILNKGLTQTEWDDLKERFKEYQFVSIENRNSIPSNAQLIGTDSTAFLADVNIQFKKKIDINCEMPEAVNMYQAMERDDRIAEMGHFHFSKFTEDPELAKRRGAEVYKQWRINAFGKEDKFYAIALGDDGESNGFLLHSYSGKTCIIELIAASVNATRGGIGTSLFKAVEYSACQRGCDEIRVGCQVRNMGAIHFYHKVGCKQVECHQVYHLWNL